MSVLKRVGALLLFVLIMLLAVLAYMTMTHGGLQRLFALGKSYVAGELTIGDSTGALIGPATFSDVALNNEDGLSVLIDDIRFDWRPGKLLRRTLQIDELMVDGIIVRLPAPADSEPASQPFQLSDISLPLKADIKNIRITDVQVYAHGATEPFVLNEIKLDASGEDSSLKLVQLSVDGPTFTFAMDGTLDTRDAWPLNLNPQWTFTHETAGQFVGAGSFTGDTEKLRALHKINGPATVDLDLELSDVTGKVSWDGQVSASVDDLEVFSPGAAGVPVTLTAQTSGSMSGYEVDGTLDSGHPAIGTTNTAFNIEGDLASLTINRADTTIENSPVNLSVDGVTQFDGLQSDINIRWADLQWPLQATDQPVAVSSPQGSFNINGVPDNLSVTGDAEVASTQAGILNLTVDAAVSPEVVNIKTLRASPQGAPQDAALNVSGDIRLAEQEVSLAGQINQLTWPLVLEDNTPPVVQINAGDFSVEGPLDNYQLALNVDLQGKDIPAGNWSVTGTGSQSALTPLSINAETLKGQITGDGSVSWQPGTQWQMDLRTVGIDPSVQWPGIDGNINLQLSSEGNIGEAGLIASNRITALDGSYRNQSLTGSGQVDINGNAIKLDNIAINVGEAVITADGVISEALDVQWNASIPKIEKLLPDVSGQLAVQGQVTGAVAQPQARFSINAENLNTSGTTIQSIRGNGNLDVSGGERSSIKLDISNVVSGGQTISAISVDGSGTPAQHSATVNVTSEVVKLALNADGSVENGGWNGVVQNLNIDNPQAGVWSLAKPAAITANAQQVTASALCLQNSPSSLCVDADWNSTSGTQAKVAIDSLDTKRFQQYMPPDLNIDALVNGTADVSLAPGENPMVSADISVPGGTMDYLDGGEPKSTALGASRVQLELRDDNLNAKVDLDLGEDIGTVNAITNIGELSGARKLGGSVKTDIKDISPFSAFAPGLDSFDGALNTNMKLAGSVDQPRVAGDSELDALVLEVPSVAMKLVDGKIIARSDGKGGLLLSGKAQSGEGTIELQGSYDPAARKLDATIKGENFRVANARRQRAEISPDITVRMDGDDINVSGLLHIPTAFIDTGGSSGLVKESPDVVLVNDEAGAAEESASRVTVDVRVTLGDDIRVKAGQFSGALAGELAVEQAPGGVPTGVGAIEVVSGDFIVYGQKLTMEQGRVLFGGGPVTNPALEFDVAREVAAYEVKAGARIRGTAQAPILQLQSEPAQTDANTLSFILLGTPVDTAGVSYTFGKYITPDIYVSYERDLFTKVQTFSVRYRINDRLTLLASSSEDVSGSDLVYTWQR